MSVINPPNTPLVDSRGLIRTEWYRFLVAIQKGLTDAGSTSEDDVLSVGGTIAGAADDDAASSDSAGLLNPFAPPPGFLTAGTALEGGGDMGGNVTITLSDTAVAPGAYGSATRLASLTVDQQGRLTFATDYELNSDNVTEGGTNLFFTQARARAALSGGTGISYNSGTGAIALNATPAPNGTYANPTSITIASGIITAIS